MVRTVRIREIYSASLCCEPIVRRMPNGDLLCAVQSGGTYEPSPENRVYVFRSRDNGETWAGEGSIFPENGMAVYNTELSVLDGEVTAYLTLHTGLFLDWDCRMMKSSDSGKTWRSAGSPPCLPEYTFFRGMIETRDGRILQPYQHYPVTREEHDRILYSDLTDKIVCAAKTPYCESGLLISTDRGASYTRYPACRMPIEGGKWPWSEPTAAELSDGSIAMLLRWDYTKTYWRCDSPDGGKTWGELRSAGIPTSDSKPKLLNLDGGRIGLLHTPDPSGLRRSPLELWVSDDDMDSWGERARLTDFPGTYHYCDGFCEAGHILFTVEHNRHTVLFFDLEI